MVAERDPGDWESAQKLIREFVKERDWERFHNLKDLVIGLGAESGELLETVLWFSPEEIEERFREEPALKSAMVDEVADVLFFVLRLCDKLQVSPQDILLAKMQKNREKYPVDKARGSAEKYTRFSKAEDEK